MDAEEAKNCGDKNIKKLLKKCQITEDRKSKSTTLTFDSFKVKGKEWSNVNVSDLLNAQGLRTSSKSSV